ncbi:MAG: trimeric intracellular cation channel family protein, partial [Thermoproteus sp.]|nr:trimeric intracellular cation channel family protein [Thermoproteus sp.]
EKDMDLLGFVVLGFSTALAGGIIRDLMLGRTPPVNLIHVPYQLAAVAASLATFALYEKIHKHKDVVLYPDALGLGAFSAIGADAAVARGLNPLAVMAMAAITAAGGGVVRDVLAAEIPTILRREIYATAAAVGGLVYMALYPAGRGAALLGTTAAVTALRIASLRFGWELPRLKNKA